MSVGSIIAAHVGTGMKALTAAAKGTEKIAKGGIIESHCGKNVSQMAMDLIPKDSIIARHFGTELTPKALPQGVGEKLSLVA